MWPSETQGQRPKAFSSLSDNILSIKDGSCVPKMRREKTFHITFIEVQLVKCSLVVLQMFLSSLILLVKRIWCRLCTIENI